MRCNVCGTENIKEAKFCKACGAPLEKKNICPSCGLENKMEANYCKACGTELKKQKNTSIGRFIFDIISICFCGFIILYCLAATFTDFLSASNYASTIMGLFDESNINLFNAIKNIADINSNSIVIACGSYGKAAYLLPSILSLLGILIAMIGCIVALALAIGKSIQSGLKKELPKLERYAVMSTGFLFVGLMVVSLNSFNMLTSLSEMGYINFGFSYGVVVLSAIWIGILWMLISLVAEIIFCCVEGSTHTEIKNRLFKTAEMLVLSILLFNIAASFAVIQLDIEGMKITFQFAGLSYFKYAYLVAGISTRSQVAFSKELRGSLVMSTILLVFLLVFIAIGVLFFIKRGTKKKEETPKPSLCCSIVFICMAIVFLILSCVAAPMIFKDTTLFDLLIGDATEILSGLKSVISGNVIVFGIFSYALLAIEVLWKVLGTSKSNKPKENN